ncbi:hypothetical protein [Candidatus Pelagibacter sp.]|uniref:hypothetical protein n=1 Tax=Candidatus Pelagibacter sp. TaxID=2024849 RepID=UPI003F830F7E
MNDLAIKLKKLETKILENRDKKRKHREKVEKREKEIHQKVIKIWNKEVLNNKRFHSKLNQILSAFKKIDPKNKRYFWRIFEFDISKKENLKDNFTFYVNNERSSLQLNLSGLYTDITVNGESFKIENVQKAKETYLNEIIEIFRDQN